LPDITGTLVTYHYSISRETFELTTQDLKTQEHILLKNTKSGTLIKRSLGKKGETQKLPTKQIYEVARAIDKSSRLIHKHFRLLLFVCESENLIFFVDSFGERDSDLESSEHKKSRFEQELEKPKNSESLAELINAPVVEDKEDTLETPLENKSPKAIILEETDEEETLISKSDEGKEEKIVTEVTKEKIIILDDNDDFILSQKNDAPLPKNEDSEINQAKNTPIAQEKVDVSEKPKNSEKKINPDNEFFMSIILDLEPALTKKY
jgi:hypothetical protein